MFEKYGNFNSCEEINEKAAELLAASDEQSLMELAKENGIDEDDALDLMDGAITELCNPLIAAMGKILVESNDIKKLEKQEIFNDWIDYIEARLPEDRDLQIAVRRKDKSLIGCLGHILSWSYSHAYEINKGIVEASGIKMSGKVKLGIPGSGTVKKLIVEYYTGKKAE